LRSAGIGLLIRIRLAVVTGFTLIDHPITATCPLAVGSTGIGLFVVIR
jgi:hypothetical protein